MTRLIPILLLYSLCADAQVLSPRAASQVTTKSGLTLPVAIVVPPSTQYLTWDSDYTEWKVYVGTSRNLWTTNFLTFNKFVPLDNSKFYGVASVVGGTESPLAYWPSNRVVNIVVEVSDSPSGNFVGSFTWITYTNKILGQKKFMRLNEQFLRWE